MDSTRLGSNAVADAVRVVSSRSAISPQTWFWGGGRGVEGV
jgi:hypothetical protein